MDDTKLAKLIRDPRTSVRTYKDDLDRYGGTNKSLSAILSELSKMHNRTVVFTLQKGCSRKTCLETLTLPEEYKIHCSASDMVRWTNTTGSMGYMSLYPYELTDIRGLAPDCLVLHCPASGPSMHIVWNREDEIFSNVKSVVLVISEDRFLSVGQKMV